MEQRHITNAGIAKERYIQDKYLSDDAHLAARSDWASARRIARREVANALRSSSYLADIQGALIESGASMLAFRHMIAPPISQDQFKLLCPEWPKGSEKTGSSMKADAAHAVALVVNQWLDPSLAPWKGKNRLPTSLEVRHLLNKVSSLIATKWIDTAQRNRLAERQEGEVTDALVAMGWKQLPSKLIDNEAMVPARHFMHKTRFATGKQAHQEVDVACGLSGRYMLAMECKVSNDATNSVKRINDVIKKAAAWQDEWGRTVETAALLDGVIKPEDVQRLTEANVHVFWSHALDEFCDWLSSRA